MALSIGISFPSEAEALRRHLDGEKELSPAKRLALADDLSSTAIALSRSGGVLASALKRQLREEDEWRQRMREFIAKHVASK